MLYTRDFVMRKKKTLKFKRKDNNSEKHLFHIAFWKKKLLHLPQSISSDLSIQSGSKSHL